MWTKCNFLFTVLRDNFPFQSKVHQTSSDQPGKNKKILYSEKDAPHHSSQGHRVYSVISYNSSCAVVLNTRLVFWSWFNESLCNFCFSLEMHSIVQYVNPNSNVTIPNPNKQSRSTALITLQASGLSMNISRYTKEGKQFVIYCRIRFKNIITFKFLFSKKTTTETLYSIFKMIHIELNRMD